MTEIVSSNEYSFSMFAANELRKIGWARELVTEADAIADRIVNVDDKSKLFEIRFAYYLAQRGFSAVYEHKTGVGNSSVDFFVDGRPSWLMELVSLRPSDAVKNSTITCGNVTQMELSSFKAMQAKYDAEQSGAAPDEVTRLAVIAGKGSIEGEILRAQRQLGEKVAKKRSNHKFPAAVDGSVNSIVVDGRGFAGGGDNHSEFNFICTGRTGEFMGSEEIIYYWLGKPILGIFHPGNDKNNASIMRERIHVLHFISEREEHYIEGGLEQASVFFCVNGLLGKSSDLGNSYPGPLRSRNG